MSKKRFLKSILATSALAAALMPAQAALGAAVATNALAANTDGTGMAGPVTDGTDSVQIHANSVALTLNPANNAVGVDLNTKSGVTITSAGAVSVGSIGNGGANTAALTVAAGNTVTLTGTATVGATVAANTYTGLGNMTFADNAGTINVTPAAAADLAFAGNVVGTGTLNITNAANNTTFNGTVGASGALLKAIDVKANSRAVFTKDVYAAKISLQDDANTKVTVGSVAGTTVKTTDAAGINVVDNGSLITANKVTVDGHVTLTTGNGAFTVGANSDATLKGNILGHANANTTIGNGGTLTLDGTADRTVASDISGAAANQGTLVIGGKVTATSLGAGNALADVQTGTGLVTLTGAMNTKKLSIGTGDITTNSNVTIGADGVVATEGGKLTFTANKTLALSGNYAATGGIHYNENAANALTVDSVGGARTISSAITTENAISKLAFTDSAGAAASLVTMKKDIGEAAKKFAAITLTGANDRVLLDGVKAYATEVVLSNAGSELQFSGAASVEGDIKAAGADQGILVLKGTGTVAGGDNTKLDTNNAFAAFNVDKAASNSTLTIRAVGGNNPTFKGMNFNQTNPDASGLVFDLTDVAAATAYTLTVGDTGVLVANNLAAGSVKFINNTNNNNVILTLGAVGVGTDSTRHLKLLDNAGQKLTINGNGKAVHVGDLRASELTLNNVSLGMYDAATANSPSKITVTTANSTLLEGAKLATGVTVNFATNHALTLAKGVGMTNGKLTSTGNGQGTLVLSEGNTVTLSQVADSTNPLAAIQFAGTNGKVATIDAGTNNIHANAVTFNNGAVGTLNLTGNLYGSVTNATDTEGHLVLKGGDVRQSIGGAGQVLNKVTIDTTGTVVVGADEAANRDFRTGSLVFAKDGTLNLHQNVTNVFAGAISTNSSTPIGTIVVNNAVTTNGNVGTDTKMLKNVKFADNKTLTVGAGNEFHVANVTTATAGEGTVAFAGASTATETVLGSPEVKLANVTLGGNVDIGSVYSNALNIAGNTLTVKNVETRDGIAGAGTVNVKEGGTIGKTITALNTVTTVGNATLTGDLAGTLTLNGAAGKVVTFSGDTITGLVTNAAGSTLKLGKNVTMTAGYAGTNSAVDFGKNVATMGAGNNFALTGNTTLTLSGDKTPIVANAFTTTNADDVVTLNFLGLPSAVTLAKKADGTALVLQAAGANAATKNFALTGNSFVKSVAYDAATGVLTPTRETDVTKVAPAGTNTNGVAMLKQLLTASSSDAPIDAFVVAFNAADTAGKKDLVQRVSDQSHLAAACGLEALQDVANVTAARTGVAAAMAADAALGVAAGGDASDRFGVWGDVTFGNATQKLRKSTPGFKSTSYGAHVGVDTMLNDHMSVGLVLGNANSTVKHKDTKAGDKTKANSWMFGAYGTYDLANNYFLQGNLALAQTSVKAKRKAGAATASGKYDVMAYAAELRGGYRYRFDNAALVPTAGLRFSYLGDTSYTEKNGAHNIRVAGKTTSNISAVAGLSLSTALDVNGMSVTPEVHMNVDYALSNRAPKADYNFDGSAVKFAYKGDKPGKFAYNFGASAMAKQDNIEYGVGYDARIADKYVGHQGSLKVKVSF